MDHPIVMILGWRSGTSSLTKKLYEEGFPVTPPLDMRPMEGHQPEGHYENPQVYQINEALLKHLIHNERFTTSVAYTLYPQTTIREPGNGSPIEYKTSTGTRATNQLRL